MIVIVKEVLNKSEVYCEIVSGNPDELYYPNRICIDPYICNQGVESAEKLVGRTFDLGDRWAIYTILPRKFKEVLPGATQQKPTSQFLSDIDGDEYR